MKKVIFMMMALFSLCAIAQVETPDTIDIEELDLKPAVTQHSMEAYEYIDTCTTRYAVVHDWLGRCGIYDLEENKNITELEYRELYFARMMNLEDGSKATVFGAKKGAKNGIVSVGPDGDVMSVNMDDKDLFYSLDDCKTIDANITKMARKLLMKELTSKANENAMHGQVLVMDTQSGHIKAWVALEKSFDGKYVDAPLRKNQCSAMPTKIIVASMAMPDAKLTWEDSVDTKNGVDSIGGIMIKDHNWTQGGNGIVSYKEGFKHHSDIAMARVVYAASSQRFTRLWNSFTNLPREIDAMTIAALYNVVALNGVKLIEPSVNTDSVQVVDLGTEHADVDNVRMTHDILKMMLQDGGTGSDWTTKKVDLSGDYSVHRNCCPTLYDDNVADLEKYHSEEGLKTYDQIIFAGYFPSDNPRYTICVTMETKDTTSDGENISETVNKLSEYLNKH